MVVPVFVGRSPYAPLKVLAAVLLVAMGGCKTQEDAVAAATQMQSTSETLAAYYGALDHVLAGTQDAVEAESAMNGFAPPDKSEVDTLNETRKQIQLRADMAKEIGKLAALFESLTKSTSAKDSSTSAGKLGKELVSIKALSNNSGETQALTIGIQEIVSLVQQHEEIKAAKKMAPLCHDLSAFFESERDQYDSLNQAYLILARSDAQKLVKTDQVDPSPVFLSALQPFGMTPAISLAQTRTGMREYLLGQIDTNFTLKLNDAKKATDGLSDALKEMSKRVDLVAGDKTMSLRAAPPTLDGVKTWIEQVTK